MPKSSKSIKVSDLKARKPWLKKVKTFKYLSETKIKKKRFLIICEGQTEELYFKSFPVLAADIKAIHQGSSKFSLVECVPSYIENENYDEIWCVFDMDIKSDVKGQIEDYNKAIELAIREGYKCAYSNDAFELWLVLHYQFIDQQHLKGTYFSILGKYWGINYEKDGKSLFFARNIYKRLLEDDKANQLFAIDNAKKLYLSHQGKTYFQQNPVTLVYALVEELNKHLRE